MKILVVGDPHGKLGKIKKLDLKEIEMILITGDLGESDSARKFYFGNLERKRKGLPELEETQKLIKEIWNSSYVSSMAVIKYLAKFAPVYTMMGNVTSKDAYARADEKKFGIKLPRLIHDINKTKNTQVVKNQLRIINGLRVGFLEYFLEDSWVKEFKEKDKKIIQKAKKETEKARRVLRKFGKVDVLICHQPPYGILDKVNSLFAPKNWNGGHAGSKVILDYIKKYQPEYVFCGHIHEGKGMKKIGKTKVYNVGHEGDYALIDI